MEDREAHGTRPHAWHPSYSGAPRRPSDGGSTMPYNSVEDLPKSQVDQYNEHQKHAFLKAFNNAYKEYNGDEHRAFAVAHSAAKNAGDRPGPG
jgi:cation transport regulator